MARGKKRGAGGTGPHVNRKEKNSMHRIAGLAAVAALAVAPFGVGGHLTHPAESTLRQISTKKARRRLLLLPGEQ
jgi:hypothetical protein